MRLPTFYEQNLIPNWGIKDKRPQCSIRNTTVCHPPKDILEPCVGPMLDSGIPVLS